MILRQKRYEYSQINRFIVPVTLETPFLCVVTEKYAFTKRVFEEKYEMKHFFWVDDSKEMQMIKKLV